MRQWNRFAKIIVMSTFFLLAACEEVEFKNGRIPSEYLSKAKSLTGNFSGRFYKQEGQLSLKLQGDLAVLSYKSEKGEDLLGSGDCKATIGRLKKAKVKNNSAITHLIFAFNPGSCDIPGRELTLEFSKNYTNITLSLADYDYLEEECEWTDRGRNPSVPPVYECHKVVRKHYFTGNFVKITP